MDEKKTTLKIDRNINEAFPSNSKTKKEKPKPQRITTGRVIRKKKSLGKKFSETFIAEDSGSVLGYILHDVLIPAAKDMIYDTIKGSVEMSLFGTTKSSPRTKVQGRSHVAYNSIRDDRTPRHISNKDRAIHRFDDIVLESRGEAEEVLSHLVDLTIDYGQATVSDLYDLVGITGNFTDNKWGWMDLGSASVSRGREGYILNLPKPILID